MSNEREQAWEAMRKLMSTDSMERSAWEAHLAKLVALQPRVVLTDEQRYARYLEVGR